MVVMFCDLGFFYFVKLERTITRSYPTYRAVIINQDITNVTYISVGEPDTQDLIVIALNKLIHINSHTYG